MDITWDRATWLGDSSTGEGRPKVVRDHLTPGHTGVDWKLPHQPWEEPDLPTPWPQTSSLQSCVTIILLCKPPCIWGTLLQQPWEMNTDINSWSSAHSSVSLIKPSITVLWKAEAWHTARKEEKERFFGMYTLGHYQPIINIVIWFLQRQGKVRWRAAY